MKILIAEDSLTTRMLLTELLQNLGHDVLATSDGEEAWTTFKQEDKQEEFTLLIVDWVMPRMDGLELCRRIRAEKRSSYTYIILLTALHGKENYLEAMDAGVDDFITKPFDEEQLAARLRVAQRILQEMAERQRAEAALKQANDELELRVQERTAKLRESEQQFRLLVDGVKEYAIYMLDNDGRITSWNSGAERIKGYQAEEIIGRHFSCFYTAEDIASGKATRVLQEAVAQGHHQDEGWRVRKDGSLFCADVVITPVHDEHGQLRGFAKTTRDITEQKRAESQIRLQLRRLSALRTIDRAISSSLNLRSTLDVILNEVTAQLGTDSAAVLLLNKPAQRLEYAAGRGFRTKALQHTVLHIGEGYAGRAAIERNGVSIPNLAEAPGDFTRAPLMAIEGFISYFAVPLIAKGQVQGVLEIFQRAPLDPGEEWLEFFEMLAGQAAIAIDNAALFEDLQRTNAELFLAYDTTLEGWSRALDLRDKETEGHTQRVADLTTQLARAMAMPDAELIHVQRGALLHDIGKMGVPDSILLKPGPLTEEEWVIMRKHPVFAYELLSPIAFLRPALDIPYCHHEKWDGSGYPRGLKGEQIPLAARLFAVIDVWDALRSDRPYRAGWPEDKVREHIRAGSGTHFDPQIVEVFLKLLSV